MSCEHAKINIESKILAIYNKDCYHEVLIFLASTLFMNVSLTPKLEVYVKQKVSTGLYNSASEVIREGLRLLEERDSFKQVKLQALQKELATGLKSLDAGKGRAFNKEEIKSKGRSVLDNN